MIKNIVQMEVKIGELVSQWHIESGTPFDVAEQMLLQLLQLVGKWKENAAAQQAAAQPAETKSAELVSEPEQPKAE